MEKKKSSLSRRQLLQRGALAGAGLLVPWHLDLSKAMARPKKAEGGSAKRTVQAIPLEPDPCPITPAQFFTAPLVSSIPVARPKFSIPGVYSYYEIISKASAFPFHIPLAGTLGLTPTYGYADSFGTQLGYLGPTIEAQKFEKVVIKFINQLPAGDTGPFGLQDPNFVGPGNTGNGGGMIVHLHGGHVPPIHDGGPERMILPGQSKVYEWPNIQEACMLWYHDHMMDWTRLNAYAGLAALYFIRDSYEKSLNLPKGPLEIPLVLQDKAFYRDGPGTLQLWYANPWIPEVFGNSMVVNAQLYPTLEVEPRRYRFRMLNASQARFLHLRLSDHPSQWKVDPKWGTRVPNSALPFMQIGFELGFVPNAVQMNSLLLGNAERADVIVDFKGMQGRDLYLSNDAMTPYDPSQPPLDPDGPDPNPALTTAPSALNVMQMMKIHVKNTTTRDTTMVIMPGTKIKTVTPPSLASVVKTRQITLVEAPYDFNPIYSKVLVNNRRFHDNIITETPRLNTTEIWEVVNMTPDTHPMHFHNFDFFVVNRQALALNPAFDPINDPTKLQYLYGADGGGSQIATEVPVDPKYLDGPVIPPYPNEYGPKDTVKMNPGEVTRIIIHFRDYTGPYVYHCHILDHEEMDMMQYMNVLPPVFGKDRPAELPKEFALQQNYPNPFNPSTQIEFHLPEDGNVSLRVFNALGQEIAQLVNGSMSAGVHKVTFDGANLASGTYYYRLEAGSFSLLKKMMLVK